MADDKLTYTYVPEIVRYYLGEEPILPNVATYRLEDPDQLAHVLDHLDRLVLKPVGGSGGYGILIGPQATDESWPRARAAVEADPRAWIAQEVVALSTAPTSVGNRLAPRHLDLRPFAVNDGRQIWVVPGGLTRVALPEGGLVVNSSQGGGSKDTWVTLDDRRSALTQTARTVAHRSGGRRVAGFNPDDSRTPSRTPARARAPGSGISTRQQQQQQQQQERGRDAPDGAAGQAECDRAEPDRREPVLDRPLHGAGRGHRPHPRRPHPSPARGAGQQRDRDLPGPAGRHGRAPIGRPAGIAAGADRNSAGDGDGPDARLVTEVLAFSDDNPSSIVSSLTAARANARGVSEAISSEMWEALNTTYNALPGQVGLGRRIGPHGFFRFVRERAAVDRRPDRLDHEPGRRLALLGPGPQPRTGRHAGPAALHRRPQQRRRRPEVDWVLLLRSCSAHEAFLRTYRREPEPLLAAEFLLLDRLFPRSVFCALSTAEVCLAELDPRSDRAGLADESRRILGRVRTQLEFRRIDDLLQDFTGQLDAVQAGCGAASAALAARYFRQTSPIEWTREGLEPGRRLRDGGAIVTWRIRVEHHSRYEYADVVYSSYNEARITPMTTPSQLVLDARLEVDPAHQPLRYVDYWGTVVHAFDLHQPHRDMDVVGRSVVETTAPAPPPDRT